MGAAETIHSQRKEHAMLRATIAFAGSVIMMSATVLLVLAIALNLPVNLATIALLVLLLSGSGLATAAFIRLCL